MHNDSVQGNVDESSPVSRSSSYSSEGSLPNNVSQQVGTIVETITSLRHQLDITRKERDKYAEMLRKERQQTGRSTLAAVISKMKQLVSKMESDRINLKSQIIRNEDTIQLQSEVIRVLLEGFNHGSDTITEQIQSILRSIKEKSSPTTRNSNLSFDSLPTEPIKHNFQSTNE